MHFVHLTNPCKYNILSVILALVCAPISLSSICKLLILVYEHIFRLKQVEQMCKCVTISPQSKLKTFSTLFLRYLSRNSCSKFGKVLWWSLWIEVRRNFLNSSFVKNFFLNLNLFQALQSEMKNLLKEDASCLNIAWRLHRKW